MNYSVTIFQTAPLHEWLGRITTAESLGFETVWVGDSPMIWREGQTSMTAALQATTTIRIGMAVTNPVTRHITVTASAFATMAELSGSRAVLGMGLGDSAVETIGKRPARLSELEENLVALRSLLKGERVQMGDVEARLDWLPQDINVPVFVGGSGPKMLRLAGAHGDGVIVMAGANTDLLSVAVDQVETGSKGNRPYTVAWVPASILDAGGEARDSVRGHVARCATHALPWEFSGEDQQAIERLKEAYDYYGHLFADSKQAELVPDRLVELFAVAGSPEDARRRVQQLRDAPVDEVAFVLHGRDPEHQLRLLADVLGTA